MKNPIIISGPQGSGKTSISDLISKRYKNSNTVIPDNAIKMVLSGYFDRFMVKNDLLIIDACSLNMIGVFNDYFYRRKDAPDIIYITSFDIKEADEFNVINLY